MSSPANRRSVTRSRFVTPALALLALALLALPATAFAALPTTFTVNTQAFDFTDSSIDTAYVGFALVGGQLQVDLSSQGSLSAVPAITVALPGQATDTSGNTVYPRLRDLKDVAVTSYGPNDNAISVLHSDVGLSAATSDWTTALEGLGLSATQEKAPNVNTTILDFTNGTMNLRLVLHRAGSDVTAFLQGVSAPAQM